MSSESNSFAVPGPQSRVYRPSKHSVGHRRRQQSRWGFANKTAPATSVPDRSAASPAREPVGVAEFDIPGSAMPPSAYGPPADGRPWFRDEEPDREHPAPPGFLRLVMLTVLGALFPGAGLLAAGRRRLGTLVLSTFVWSIVAAVAGIALGLHERIVVRPDVLRLLAGAFVTAGLVWALVIAVSYLSLRQGRLRAWQNVIGAVLVVALMSAAMGSTAKAAQYSLAQADLVEALFERGNATKVLERGEKRINVLLLGSDAGDGRVGVRPDTLIVASIDTASGDTILFTLPRNLQKVPFPRGTPGAKAWPNGFDCGDACLLNAVWAWGEQNADKFPGDPSPGLTATRQAVSATLGLPLHYYAMVNLDGFQDVVDAMGGVTLNVPRPLPIGGGTDQLTGRENAIRGYVPAGVQRLNGYNALWYARSRADSSDYDRMKRQRCFLDAVVAQAQPRTLAAAFPKLAKAAKDNIRTDISLAELDAWVKLAQRVQDAEVRSLPFTDEVIKPVDPDFAAIRRLVRQALQAPDAARKAAPASPRPSARVAPSKVQVRVLNGTDVPGLGARTAEQLRARGFVVADVSDARATSDSTVVRFGPGLESAAATLAAAMGGSDRKRVASSDGAVTLVVGTDFDGVLTGAGTPSSPRSGPAASPSVAPQVSETC